MKKTSFGFIESYLEKGELREKLTFQKSGRFHKHETFEIFKVLSGSGELHIEDKVFKIEEGHEYKVAPGKDHKMIPDSGAKLEVVLRYQEA